MGMQIDNVWQFGLRLTNTAFKPALGEVRKKHSVCTKIRLFEIQNQKIFLGRGHKGHPLPTPHPLRRLNLHAYRSHTSFFRKRSLSRTLTLTLYVLIQAGGSVPDFKGILGSQYD